jgi:hypothetical protein
MKRWRTPEGSNWESPFQLVCFNDECPYFLRSGDWMRSQYNVSVLYRHRHDPASGDSGPVPVWSKDALKDAILPDEDPGPLEPGGGPS